MGTKFFLYNSGNFIHRHYHIHRGQSFQSWYADEYWFRRSYEYSLIWLFHLPRCRFATRRWSKPLHLFSSTATSLSRNKCVQLPVIIATIVYLLLSLPNFNTKKNYSRLPYVDIFGGVTAMSAEHFQLVNGYSNMFWGWGGEDDDLSMRIKMKGLHVLRYPLNVARYTMLTHKKAKINPQR